MGTTALRCASAYGLIHYASRSIKGNKARYCARAGGMICSAIMLAPPFFLKKCNSPQLARHILLDNFADIGYAATRDPAQSALRNFGPRVSLKRPGTKAAPHLLAFLPLSCAYSAGAMLWYFLFKESISPVTASLAPVARNAINTIGPASTIEGTEAVASAVIFSAFPGAIHAHNYSIEIPEPRFFLIMAAMRIFATGILQICNLIANLCFGMPEGMPVYAMGLIMFFLEWLGAVSQQAIANITATPDSKESKPLTRVDGKHSQFPL